MPGSQGETSQVLGLMCVINGRKREESCLCMAGGHVAAAAATAERTVVKLDNPP